MKSNATIPEMQKNVLKSIGKIQSDIALHVATS